MKDKKESIAMYDLADRVKRYDVDMDLMHPNRPKMCDIALDFLQYNKESKIKAIDLGIGTGFFTKKILQKFPNSQIVAIDGAAKMIDLAKSRLGKLVDSIEFIVGDFNDLPNLVNKKSEYDVIFTSFALHHLTIPGREKCMKDILELLKPGGWVVNADIIIGETKELEDIYQKLRIDGILKRADGKDSRFKDFASTRSWLDEMEAKEKDNPIKLSVDLDIIQKAGFRNVDILWKEYREAVWCAQK